VTLWAAELPPGSTFDPVAGAFAWIPSSEQVPGSYTVRITATDGALCNPGHASVEWVIQVTDPLALMVRSMPGGLQLTFPALAGGTYRVESCTDLGLTDWEVLAEITSPQTDSITVPVSITGPSPARFYRVLWLR
jgi:hypothetical protein